MEFDQTEGGTPEGQCVYALVIYIPDPLGRFLDDLRRELVPHYNPHAHVSVLPPRWLPIAGAKAASDQAKAVTEAWPSFEVELSGIDVFTGTDVIYIEVSKGATDLRGMHAALNAGALAFKEPFAYHPHITLAQEIPHEQVSEMIEAASRRWQEYRGSRSFHATRAVFVRNAQENCWEDLEYFAIGSAVAVR